MNIRQTCSTCEGSGFINRPIKVGDIIRLGDGSGMSNALHHILWNGHGRKDLPLPFNEAFKPVRVLAIEGNMLAVVPLHWDDKEIEHKERFDDKVYPALCWINSSTMDAFWIYAPTCHPFQLV